MDDIDKAQQADETQRNFAIAGAVAARSGLVDTGRCRLCDEPLPRAGHFCGPACRDRYDYERRMAAQFPRVAD